MRLIAPVIAVVLLSIANAGAQSEATLVPAVAVSTVYDDNLFSAPNGVGDMLSTIRPSIEGRYESSTTSLQSLASLEMQRSARHEALNVLDARQHVSFEGLRQFSPAARFGLMARYDRTETPADLNLESAILLARQRARRIQFTPSFSYRSTPRTTITTRYDWTSENLSDWGGGDLHAAHIGIAREWTPRTTVSARLLGRVFVDDVSRQHSEAAVFGVTRELTALTSLSLEAGPRVTSYSGPTSEVLAAVLRRTPRTRLRLDYWHGETIVLGIAGPVAIHSGTANVSWAVRRPFEIGTQVGVFDSHTIEDTQALVYHAAIIGAWTRQPYILTFSYGTDLQKGDIRTRGASDETVRRGVFLLRLTVAPRLSRAFRPREDTDQPLTPLKGVIE